MEGFILKPQEAKKKIENLEVPAEGHYTSIIKNTELYKPLGRRDKSRIKTMTLRSISGWGTVGLQQMPSKGTEEQMQIRCHLQAGPCSGPSWSKTSKNVHIYSLFLYNKTNI